MALALSKAAASAAEGAKAASDKIRFIRKIRTGSEILVLIGSSSILGTFRLTDSLPVTVAAIATFIAACGSLFAEHISRILNPNLGNVYDAFQNLQSLGFKAGNLANDLLLAVRFDRSVEELSEMIARGNEVMSEVNQWSPQVLAG